MILIVCVPINKERRVGYLIFDRKMIGYLILSHVCSFFHCDRQMEK